MTNQPLPKDLTDALTGLTEDEIEGVIDASLSEWAGNDFKLWTGEFDDEGSTFVAESDIPYEGEELDEDTLVINKRQMTAVLQLSDRLIEVIRRGLR